MEPLTPLPLRRVREPFDDPACVYELECDGFRTLLFLDRRGAALDRTGGHRHGRDEIWTVVSPATPAH